MNFYHVVFIILSCAIMVGYLNHRYIKMPTTIAVMGSSLLVSLFLIISGQMGLHGAGRGLSNMLISINFHDLLMNGMLSFLLFAGAMSVDLHDLRHRRWEIGILASLGTIASTVLVGGLSYYLLRAIGIEIDLIHCMLFGALISPTDPIAVLAMFRQLGAPKEMSIFLEGESLFNDGVGIVIFLTLYELAFNGHDISARAVSLLFLRQAGGGIIYGLILGYVAHQLMKSADNHRLQILLTIAVATGGYAFAQILDISGPLAMVVAGIMVGNRVKELNNEGESARRLHLFWEVIDEVLNILLFVLIGFELLIITMPVNQLVAALVAVPLVLGVRFVCVALPMQYFKRKQTYFPHMVKILTWGGLRGGLAVALALALPQSEYRNLILMMTYTVVIFAILFQGMTIKPMIAQSLRLQKSQT
ncbi:MAG: sodium:proton antiporter [Legionellales bacterium]|nr:sodium:proton antiporter [Legionellales bacterium]|tara:strand:- start:9925 stop:11178 length:1254 start_codon:yes stop_codon:yes gene_type:complete